jgi:hypothetical protein
MDSSSIDIPYNITPFTGATDDPVHLKQMVLVKAPLKIKFDGKIESHYFEITQCIQNTGLYHEFAIRTHENPRPIDIPHQWMLDHPLTCMHSL